MDNCLHPGSKPSSHETLVKLLGPDYQNELCDVDATCGVFAEILIVLRASVEQIEDRLAQNVAYRTDTYETEAIALERSRHAQ